MRRMAETMEAQAREIEGLRMELQRTSIKPKDDIPDITPGSLEDLVQKGGLARWMCLFVGALKKFFDKGGCTAVDDGSYGG